jgi:hypothetical protein
MKLAILLWIYKDVEVCVNRARWLRRQNPGTPVYCLYGGPMDEADRFRQRLEGLIDDFHVFDEDWDELRKWLKGDEMLAHWHRQRGVTLDWDTVFIAQWDLALLAPVQKLCGALETNQLLLPGLRPIAQVEHFWSWVRPETEAGEDFELFRRQLLDSGELPADPLCCNFVAAALPREFLGRYANEAPLFGFLEYKLPMLAQAWGFGFCEEHAFDVTWLKERDYSARERFWVTLHAEKYAIHPLLLFAHRAWPWGCRVFHPYQRAIGFGI